MSASNARLNLTTPRVTRRVLVARVATLALMSSLSSNIQAQELTWAGRLGGSLEDERGYSIAVDNRGNVYTTGWFHGVADFDPGPGLYSLTSNGNADIYVSKLDADGHFIWAKHMGGLGYDTASSIAVDHDGNVYTTGGFHETADFDPDPNVVYNLTAPSSTSGLFLSKLDGAGDLVWAKRVEGGGNCVTVDRGGNIYLTGPIRSLVGFNADISVSKLDTDGNLIWVRQMGGGYDDTGQEVTTDLDGNVYTTGSFSGTADFDPGPGVYYLTTSINVPDAFVSKLDVNGEFVWAVDIGGSSPDGGSSIAVDARGNVYTTGGFQGTADFDPGPGTFNIRAGWVDIFVSKLDSDGDFLWAQKMGGRDDDGGNSIALDIEGNVYGTGYFSITADFDPSAGMYTLTSAGATDSFVFKLGCDDDDHDEVCDTLDQCLSSVVTPTVVIDSCDTGVPNIVLETGCTIGDLIAACRDEAANHGEFVRCVAHLAIDRGNDVIRCTAQSRP